mmetsp:Transcript_19130/g.58973  ORF Transcript_19130/g.58973 Transcript_19130/m.58973 type:complete len:215 (+) Transcript_19130:1544-2188(+)
MRPVKDLVQSATHDTRSEETEAYDEKGQADDTRQVVDAAVWPIGDLFADESPAFVELPGSHVAEEVQRQQDDGDAAEKGVTLEARVQGNAERQEQRRGAAQRKEAQRRRPHPENAQRERSGFRPLCLQESLPLVLREPPQVLVMNELVERIHDLPAEPKELAHDQHEARCCEEPSPAVARKRRAPREHRQHRRHAHEQEPEQCIERELRQFVGS